MVPAYNLVEKKKNKQSHADMCCVIQVALLVIEKFISFGFYHAVSS